MVSSSYGRNVMRLPEDLCFFDALLAPFLRLFFLRLVWQGCSELIDLLELPREACRIEEGPEIEA